LSDFGHAIDGAPNTQRTRAKVVQDIHDERVFLAEKPEQKVLRPHVLVVPAMRFLARLDQRATHSLGEVVARQKTSSSWP
jgi:hypothetical protein